MNSLNSARRWASVIVCAAILGVGGCSAPPGGAEGGRPVVAAAVPPLAWLAGRVGGDGIDVFAIVGPGESPATFQPSDALATRLSRASLLLRSGVPAENGPWFRSLSARDGLRVVDLREGIEVRRMSRHPHDAAPRHGGSTEGREEPRGLDPHLWLSPRLLAVQAATVAESLCELDPPECPGYRGRLRGLQAELEALDLELAEKLRPLRGAAFLVFHPAWGYLADAYGLHQVAVEIEGKSPSDAELHALAARVERDGVRVLFVQPQISGRTATVLADRLGVRVETLDPLAEDVPANLRVVAERLIASRPTGQSG